MLAVITARPAATSLHKFGRDFFGHRRAEILARMLLQHHGGKSVALLVFANGDIFHLRRNNALPRIVHLGDVLAGLGFARCVLQIETHLCKFGVV